MKKVKTRKSEWAKKVYAPSQKNKIIGDYETYFEKYCKEFNYQCQACRKKHRKMRLSLHHIIPVIEGGSNDYDNIILVCKECHNKIEEESLKYRSYNSILWAFARQKGKRPIKEISNTKDWHKWVYGGQRNPLYSRIWIIPNSRPAPEIQEISFGACERRGIPGICGGENCCLL